MLMIPNVGRTFDESSTTTNLSTLFGSLYLYPCDPIAYVTVSAKTSLVHTKI